MPRKGIEGSNPSLSANLTTKDLHKLRVKVTPFSLMFINVIGVVLCHFTQLATLLNRPQGEPPEVLSFRNYDLLWKNDLLETVNSLLSSHPAN